MKIRLAEVRNQKNISLRHLSEMTGISKTTLNDIENGKVSLSFLRQLESIAKALNCKMGDIVKTEYW